MVRCLAAVLVALVALGAVSCDQRGGKQTTSSGVFIGPVPLAVDETTGVNPTTGERRVEAIVNRNDILRAINPGQIGVDPNANPQTIVLGKFSQSEFVLFEKESSSLLKLDLMVQQPRSKITHVISRSELSQIFSTPKAAFQDDTFLTVLDGVIFGYESSGRALFTIQREPVTGDMVVQILADRDAIQRQIRLQVFNFGKSAELPPRPATAPGAGSVCEVLLTSAVPNQAPQLFVIENDQGDLSGEFRVFDVNGDLFTDPSPIDEVFPYIPLETIQQTTDNREVEIFDYFPAAIPNSQSALLFDQATSAFLEVRVARGPDGEIRENASKQIAGDIVNMDLFTQPGEVQFVIRQGSPTQNDIPLRIRRSFPLPQKASLIAFEEETNNMLEVRYDQPADQQRAFIFSASSNLLQRRDVQGGVDPDFGLQETVLTFPTNPLRRENILFFDQGNDQMLGLNLSSSQYVVVLKQGDLAEATGLSGISDLTFIEPVTDNEVLAFDTQGNALVRIRLEYAAFPLFFGRSD